MNEANLLVIDTESGGLDPNHQSILSLGATTLPMKKEQEFEVIVRESQISAEPEALKVNKMSLEWIKENGKSPREAVRLFEDFLLSCFPSENEKVVIAGHNTWFDVAFLKRLYRLADSPFPRRLSHRLIDTSSIIQFLRYSGKISLKTGSSDEVFRYFDIEVQDSERHTALGDARATAKLIEKLSEFVK